jgi:hypothetical protein
MAAAYNVTLCELGGKPAAAEFPRSDCHSRPSGFDAREALKAFVTQLADLTATASYTGSCIRAGIPPPAPQSAWPVPKPGGR